ncbi:MAG TPA: LysR family transcriptional regulator [Pseudolabrys sp.]|nr:LysR family transcriptional regulator [Pseudolabrys sp.]
MPIIHLLNDPMSAKDFDLNLLKVLDALLAERNVTRAGKRLGRSQPAVSNSLHRLRTLLGDDLLVRDAKGLALTRRAETLRQPVREAIALVDDCLFQGASFDPARAAGVYRISTPDRLTLAVVPPLLDRLRRLAPHMDLQVMTADRQQALDLLDQDRIDLALGWFDDMPRHLNAEFLLEEYLYCVFRRGHPILKPKSKFNIAAVLSFPHLIVSATGGRRAIFDDLLSRHKLRRHALVAVSNFTAVPQLLADSDMIGVFTKLASDVFEKSFGLVKRRVPLDIGKIATNMAWHARSDRDRRHVWLRHQIKAVYKEF